MAKLILFNKPFGVLSQFTGPDPQSTLAHYIPFKGFYAAGRLDKDSEGLLLLTDSGSLQHWIAGAEKTRKNKQAKHYWVQVEGRPSSESLQALRRGITLNDGPCLPAQVKQINPPQLWERSSPIRDRKNQPTKWLSISLKEGRNRQVRRMTAAIGHPTLRLVRHRIAHWDLGELQPGEYREETVHLPQSP